MRERLSSNRLEKEKGEWDIDIIESSEREAFWQTKERERERDFDKLERKTKDEILTSLKEWNNEREAWGGVTGFGYANIECKHTENEWEVKF